MRVATTVLLLSAVLAAESATGVTLTSTWIAGTGNWSDATNWDTDPLYPDNGNGGFDYDVVIPLFGGGSQSQATLDGPITIESLDHDGQIHGAFDLTIEGVYDWGGTRTGAANTIAMGSLEILGTTASAAGASTVVNAGTADWLLAAGTLSDNRISLTGGALLRNAPGATFLADNQTAGFDLRFIGSDGTFENQGDFFKTGPGELQISSGVEIINSGLFELNDSAVILPRYTQTDGITRLDGTGVSGSTWQLQGGVLEGFGSLLGSVDSAAWLSPGLGGPGTLEHSGLELLPGSVLDLEIAGRNPGEFDELLGGNLDVDGELRITFLDGFEQQLLPGESITLAVMNTSIGGQFDNVAHGDRIFDTEGKVSFRVLYGAGSVSRSKRIILQDFELAVPEPGAGLLLATGLCALARRSCRRVCR